MDKTSKKKESFFLLPNNAGKNSIKISRLKSQYLSKMGRLTLIKSTIASIPNYSLSCFKAPISICNKIDQIIRGLWWGHDTGEKKDTLQKLELYLPGERLWGYGNKEN